MRKRGVMVDGRERKKGKRVEISRALVDFINSG